MTRPTVRCASTWSGPFWASSSITKIAVSFQNLLFADRLDQPAQGQVVVGDHRARRRLADPGAVGVVVGQAHDR